MEVSMAPFKIVSCVITALIAMPSMSFAQGASRVSPGREQKRPGQAKQYAPGQQERRLNKDKQPGAKEYAPGHEMKK
jgi:hypothetical protein